MVIDADLRRVWVFHPAGAPGVKRRGGIQVVQAEWGYGDPPYRFRPVRQNGSRLHLRLLAPDGSDARYPPDDRFLPGALIERRAYTSDVRGGVYWTPEDDKASSASDRQIARAAIRVVLRHLGAKGEREVETEIQRVQEDERNAR